MNEFVQKLFTEQGLVVALLSFALVWMERQWNRERTRFHSMLLSQVERDEKQAERDEKLKEAMSGLAQSLAPLLEKRRGR